MHKCDDKGKKEIRRFKIDKKREPYWVKTCSVCGKFFDTEKAAKRGNAR